MKIKSVNYFKNFKGKRVLLRVDFNVPLENNKVRDDYKIVAGLETIKLLLSQKAKIIIITHLSDSNLSVAPVVARLRKILNKKIKFISETINAKVEAAVKKMGDGEIIFLENLRFNKGELEDDQIFAKQLAGLADLYVNDAFAVSHRAQASVSAVKDYLPSFAGLLLEKELKALNKVIKPKKPFVVIMGGAKINTKAPLISKLYPVANQILLGGGLANNFFKFNKLEIGRSLYDADSMLTIKKLLRGKMKDTKIILPVDVVVRSTKGKISLKKTSEVKKNDAILDIGPETTTLYATYIKKAQTIIWNGPMGKFEEEHFKNGTLSIARLIATRSTGKAYGLVGGGETVEALKMSGMMQYVDWVSTAGGAMLSYLGGEKMPGLKKIVS
ncbi:MAG: phosphoglycerate kinase [Patescibacteria group bacterium]